MPNILAHSYVTSEVMGNDHPDINLGSVLPDFAGMYRDYHGQAINLKDLGFIADLGVHFHKKTDRTFDDQSEIPQATTDLTAHLEAAGIRPRASRLGATLLADVMLDSALVGEPKAVEAFDKLGFFVLEEKSILDEERFPAGFPRMVRGYFSDNVPRHYRDPDHLARIVYRRLNSRARTAQAKERSTIRLAQLPALAEVISGQSDHVRRLGLTALERTIQILDADTATPEVA